MNFTNRDWEINELNKYTKSGQLIVIYGRRRVGKTTLIKHWLKSKNGVYSQAIQGSPSLQISQILQDFAPLFKTHITPRNWIQFFELLEKSISQKTFICLDEFSYLVDSDKTLPSIFQKWIDHNRNTNIVFILSGSSQKMMSNLFLNHSSPLYTRAQRILKIEPMTYINFCHACRLTHSNISNFILYSMVGGLPKYWESLKYTQDPIELAELLYFNHGALMENEPQRIYLMKKLKE